MTGDDAEIERLEAENKALRKAAGDATKALSSLVGIHEGVEIAFVVDGYEAALTTHNGATTREVARGTSILEAVFNLSRALEGENGSE